jgi:hypothetical protein
MSYIVYIWTLKFYKSLMNNNTNNYSIKSDSPYMDRICHNLGTTLGTLFLMPEAKLQKHTVQI